jgi:hypothetical protein
MLVREEPADFNATCEQKKMNRNTIVAILVSICIPSMAQSVANPCPGKQKDKNMPTTKQLVEPIGSAKMLPDRTLVLSLRAETDGSIGHAEFKYYIEDPRYAEILRHIGGLEPGEEKVVLPFPERK